MKVGAHGHGLFDLDSIKVAAALANSAADAGFLVDNNFSVLAERNCFNGATVFGGDAFFAADAFGSVRNGGPAGGVEAVAFFFGGVTRKADSYASAGAAEAYLKEFIHLVKKGFFVEKEKFAPHLVVYPCDPC